MININFGVLFPNLKDVDMRLLFSNKYNPFVMDAWVLVLRFGVAAMMLTHGLPKLQRLMDGQAAGFSDPIGLGPSVTLIIAVFAEVVCSVFIFLGLATRLSTIPLIATMMVAVFIVHANDPFVRQEMGLLYILVYLTLLVFGAGKYSVDRIISKNK